MTKLCKTLTRNVGKERQLRVTRYQFTIYPMCILYSRLYFRCSRCFQSLEFDLICPSVQRCRIIQVYNNSFFVTCSSTLASTQVSKKLFETSCLYYDEYYPKHNCSIMDLFTDENWSSIRLGYYRHHGGFGDFSKACFQWNWACINKHAKQTHSQGIT